MTRLGIQILESPTEGAASTTQQPTRCYFQQLLFGLVFLLSALYMAHELKRGWEPFDEGTLAESAEHVLNGALPHIDYHELYTGLLSYVNALAFRAFGTNLVSMRYMLFIFFLAWVAAFHYSASRFVSALPAAAVTLLAVVWGPPNYAAAMPSWYNLFFATFGLASLLRYIEVQSRRWLILAGVCGGMSFLFKMTGLYFVAGVLLFLAFREQINRGDKLCGRREILLYRVFQTLFLFSYEMLVFAVLRKLANAATYLYFWLPNLAIGGTILWYEFYDIAKNRPRYSRFLRESFFFGTGIVLPIAVFLLRYFLTGRGSEFMADFLIQPGQILSSAVKPSVPFLIVGVVIDLILIAGGFFQTRSTESLQDLLWLGVPSIGVVGVMLLLASRLRIFYTLAWSTIWAVSPLVAVLGAGLLIRSSRIRKIRAVPLQRLFLVLAVAGTCSLIQFPLVFPIYFCYVAPLVLLSAVASISIVDRPPRLLIASTFIFSLLFAIWEVTPGFIYNFGRNFSPDIQTVRLNLERAGGLRVDARSAGEYAQLNSLIRQNAHGESILAAPNCPEVYFLYGFQPPNRDFFSFSNDSRQETASVLRTLAINHINLVVVNHRVSMFIPAVSDDLAKMLEREFPNSEKAGDFEVRWKR